MLILKKKTSPKQIHSNCLCLLPSSDNGASFDLSTNSVPGESAHLRTQKLLLGTFQIGEINRNSGLTFKQQVIM